MTILELACTMRQHPAAKDRKLFGMSHNGYGHVVNSCPHNKTEVTAAATRLNCTEDKYGNNQYTCVPRFNLTALVEFCYDSVVGFYPKDHCLRVVQDGGLQSYSCRQFTEGCPSDHYRGSDLYQFPACYQINTEDRCFYADPSCPNETASYTTEDGAIPTESTSLMNIFNTTNISSTFATPAELGSADVGVIIGSVLAVLVVLCIVLAVVFWRRRRRMRRPKRKKDREKRYSPVPGEDQELIGFPEDLKLKRTDRPEDLELKRTYRRKKIIGEYSTWKTTISDKFSSLFDDEVCVLFCFLCSDSGTPDFTDTDWLDILNEIREWMYNKDSVTSEEAQRTLDGLKSRGFLWDEDGVHLSEDVNDETVYRVIGRVIERAVEHAAVLYGILFPVYRLSSYTTSVRYLRSRRYTRESGEKCVISDYSSCDTLLIHRLQMNILTHVIMEDTDTYDEVSRYLNIPPDRVRVSDGERGSFLKELQQNGECIKYRGGSQGSVQHVNWLWRNCRPDIVKSCIGLHPHWDIYIINNTAYRKHSQYLGLPPAELCLLYCLLMVDDYTVKVKDESHIKVYNAIRERYFTDQPVCEEITAPQNLEEIVHVENDVIKFKSDDIRHDIMYAFVTECLVRHNDLTFFLTTASRDVISEYCRSWDYERSEGERCLYIPKDPDEMYNLFIDRLQLDILTHCTVSDEEIHHRISTRLHIPEEVISWSDEAKLRFLANFQKGSIKMYRARGMIVGCAGAGKTTILKRLQRKDLKTDTETTIGLEVHDDIFEIVSNKLQDFKSGNGDNKTSLHENKQLISMTDFAGQVAYYACHQIYLSRRAFYLLVVDMSKNLKDKAYNPDRHNPIGSLFENWTYGQYFVFWLQSIKTYCDDKKKKEKDRRAAKANPVILIASHKDQLEAGKVTKYEDHFEMKGRFYEELEKCLPKEQTLKSHISPKRYFEVECPPGDLSSKQEGIIDEVRKCIVQTATSLPHWGETIPIQWSYFEQIIHIYKDEKILNRADLWKMNNIQFAGEDDMDDMLRFYQEIGQIIYFPDKELRNVIILDVQWFVDAFKPIITDSTHVHHHSERVKDWDKFNETGMLSENTLLEIWEENDGASYVEHKDEIMPYMEKLGIMAEVKSGNRKLKNREKKTTVYYIPSINKMELEYKHKQFIGAKNKTPMFIFYFANYLPHFFFYRLLAKCLQKWPLLGDDMVFKNAAFYEIEDGNHSLVIAVSTTSIQLQVFTTSTETRLEEEETKQIRSVVEGMINEITKTFHNQVDWEKGFVCRDLDITEEDATMFLSEEWVAHLKNTKRACPEHPMEPNHQINRDSLLKYWYRKPNPNATKQNTKA